MQYKRLGTMQVLEGFFWLKNSIYNKHHIVIACFPKSGSSFLKFHLIKLTGFKDYHFKSASLAFNDFLYLPRIIESLSQNTITQQHFRFFGANEKYLKLMKVKPIVLVRDIFDTVISYAEHIDESYNHQLINADFIQDYLLLKPGKKYDYVIDMVLPWYFSFYATWYRASFIDNKIDAYWISYEDLMAYKEDEIYKILLHQGLSVDSEVVKASVNNVDNNASRLNVGISGRGREFLNESQIEKIISYASFYPEIDFKRIGI